MAADPDDWQRHIEELEALAARMQQQIELAESIIREGDKKLAAVQEEIARMKSRQSKLDEMRKAAAKRTAK